MKKRKNGLCLLFCLLILLGGNSCNPTPPLNANQSTIINDDSCSPPCWKRITPGKTTWEEAVLIIQAISWIDETSTKNFSPTRHEEEINWSAKSGSGDSRGRVYFSNDVVSVIEIHPENANEPDSSILKFSDMLAKLGDPEFVQVSWWRGEKAIMGVQIVYPQKGYAFLNYYYTPLELPSKTISIRPTDSVLGVWYFDTEFYPLIFTSGPIDRMNITLFKKGLQPWKGYGEYEWVLNNQ
jgi:hypothetical protein